MGTVFTEITLKNARDSGNFAVGIINKHEKIKFKCWEAVFTDSTGALTRAFPVPLL